MSRVVFLLEEPSMKVLLDGLLPRLFPGLPFWCIAHEGKSDLELSIPRKLRAWREPGVRFVVIRDNDGGDCRGLKAALRGCAKQAVGMMSWCALPVRSWRPGTWENQTPWRKRSAWRSYAHWVGALSFVTPTRFRNPPW